MYIGLFSEQTFQKCITFAIFNNVKQKVIDSLGYNLGNLCRTDMANNEKLTLLCVHKWVNIRYVNITTFSFSLSDC